MENNKPEEKKNKEKMNKILLGVLIAVIIITVSVMGYFLFFYEKEDVSLVNGSSYGCICDGMRRKQTREYYCSGGKYPISIRLCRCFRKGI